MRKILLFISAFSLLMACSKKQPGFVDSVIESRIDSVLSLMTIDEKIGQMNQLNSGGNVDEFGIMIKNGNVGSFLNEIDPVKINEMQRIAVEESSKNSYCFCQGCNSWF